MGRRVGKVVIRDEIIDNASFRKRPKENEKMLREKETGKLENTYSKTTGETSSKMQQRQK